MTNATIVERRARPRTEIAALCHILWFPSGVKESARSEEEEEEAANIGRSGTDEATLFRGKTPGFSLSLSLFLSGEELVDGEREPLQYVSCLLSAAAVMSGNERGEGGGGRKCANGSAAATTDPTEKEEEGAFGDPLSCPSPHLAAFSVLSLSLLVVVRKKPSRLTLPLSLPPPSSPS